jgi:vesicle coat complex subunit
MAVPALVEALKDSDLDVRQAVALAVGRIGSEAASAVPALRDAVKDSSPAVSEAATLALGRIRPLAE